MSAIADQINEQAAVLFGLLKEAEKAGDVDGVVALVDVVEMLMAAADEAAARMESE